MSTTREEQIAGNSNVLQDWFNLVAEGFPFLSAAVTRRARRMWSNLFRNSDLCSFYLANATWQPPRCLLGVTRVPLLPGSITKCCATSKNEKCVPLVTE
jgi:hypothetical protein